jgi:hypothetical protein
MTAQQDAALSARHRRIVDLLAAGGTQVGVAAEVGCHRTTVQRCLQRPDVQAALRRASADMRASLVRRLTAEGLAAVTRLAGRACDPDASPAERAAADHRLLAMAVQVLPREIDATVVSVPAVPQPGDVSAKDVLNDALDRAAARLGYEPVLLGNGQRGNGDG